MNTINIKPVLIIGDCPAGLTLNDQFQVEGMGVVNPEGSTLCFLAIAQMPVGQGVWQLQSGVRFFSHFSCPGCTSHLDAENRVVFLLGHADKWELCQHISEYLRLCKQYSEPEEAKQFKEAAILHQNRGEYAEATRQMELALQALKKT